MKFLNFTELQALLGNRSRSSVYRDCEAGRLPKPIKIGARLYWRESDLEAAIEKLASQ